MAPFRYSHPNDSYPLPSSSVHDPRQFYPSADPDFTPSSLPLGFGNDHAALDPSIPSFVTSSQSTTSASEPVEDFELTSFPVLPSTPTLPPDSFVQAQLPPGPTSASGSRNGSKPAEPWTSVAVTGQALTGPAYHPDLTVKGPNETPHPDSGYESSLISAPLMPPTRPTRKGQSRYSDDALLQGMHNDLPDQSLLGSMPMTPLPRSKPRSSSTSTAKQDAAEGFYCSACKTPFSTASEHQKHMARHEKKYKCHHPECTRHAGFATTNDLDRHRKGVHNEIGLEDPVWKCFVEGCKSADKKWTRQDNFRAHIDRMHKDVDANDYIAKSDRWFNEVEKPSRQRALNSQTQQLSQNQDVAIGHFQQYSGAVTEQNYPVSHFDQSDYSRSIAGEFPDSRAQPFWDAEASSAATPNMYGVYSPPFTTQGLIPYTAMNETMRGVSNNAAFSYGSMTPSGLQNDPTLSFAHREPDFMDSIRNGAVDVGYLNIVKPMKARTLPDQERMNSTIFPDWQAPSYDTTSPTIDMAPTNPQVEFAFMGGENTNPSIQFPDGDVLSSDTPSSTDLGAQEPSPSAEQITEKNNRELQHEVSQLIAKCSDRHLAQKLKESISKTIKEHASSTSVNLGTTSNPTIPDHPSGQSMQYQCRRPGCGKRFAMRNRLTKHEKRHDRIFFCTFDDCYKRFGTKTDLSRHEFRVHKQNRVWRCWANSRSRDKNKKCAMLFHDLESFEDHRKESHSRIQWPLDSFKIEQDFAGAFWCGFCNAIELNPVAVDVDGLKRVHFRYQHIENHMNEIYVKSHGHDAMKEWVELAGNGKTKAEMRNSGKRAEDYAHEDDDSEDEDDPDSSSPRSAPVNPSGALRPRATTETRVKKHGKFLQVPVNDFGPGRKRPAEFLTPEIPASQMAKVRKIQSPRSVTGVSQGPRHASISGTTGALHGSMQQPPSLALESGNVNSIVAYIKCCRCNAMPRVNEGARTCNSCFQSNCTKCIYYNRDKQQLQMTLDGRVQITN